MVCKKDGRQVSISGFAPSDEDRGITASRAKAKFAKASISDLTDIADGAPDGWGKAVSVVLDQLALLKSGEAAFRDKELHSLAKPPTSRRHPRSGER